MKPEELRIGNYYNSVKWGKPVQCTLEDFYDLCANSEGATGHPPIKEMFEPIRLTQKWLAKFGFNRDGAYWSHPNINLETVRGKSRELIIAPNRKYANEIKYVHQLQNLYFALTGAELTTVGA